MDDLITVVVVIVMAGVLAIGAVLSIRVYKSYERAVVFRLGHTGPEMVRGPGLVFLIPLIDRPTKVDLREQFIEVPGQSGLTKDEKAFHVDFQVYWRIVDPLASVVEVADFPGALQGIAMSTFRAVVGDTDLKQLRWEQEQVVEAVRSKLDEQVQAWGGTVTIVEVSKVDLVRP